MVRRRGGNCANTIEVLQQLLGVAQGASRPANTPAVSLNLLAVLPHDSSPAVQLIQDSLGPEVSLATCIYRDAHIDAASSYIIKNVASGSRTIISHSDLPEMTCDEFVRVVGSFHRSRGIVRGEEMWYHFEVSSLRARGKIFTQCLPCGDGSFLRFFVLILDVDLASLYLDVSILGPHPRRHVSLYPSPTQLVPRSHDQC